MKARDKFTLFLTIACALSVSANLSSIANAAIIVGDTIAIDFGATATGTAGYNISTHATNTGDVANLIRLSDGAATGVSLTVVGSSQDNGSGIAGNGGNTADSDIFEDGILANTNNGASGNPTLLTLTFNGLDPTLTYDLVGGTSRAPATNIGRFQTDWSVPGAASQFSDALAGAGYVSFTGLAAPGGTLVITVDGRGLFSPVSQLELTAIPEPSSIAILGLGGLALILRRRRRSLGLG